MTQSQLLTAMPVFCCSSPVSELTGVCVCVPVCGEQASSMCSFGLSSTSGHQSS